MLPCGSTRSDDILKSLTVVDEAGAIGPVSLPGQSPLLELFRDLPFGPGALDPPRARRRPPGFLHAVMARRDEVTRATLLLERADREKIVLTTLSADSMLA